MIVRRCGGIQVNGKRVMRAQETVAIEDYFRLYLNDQLITDLVASPDQLEELGAGFVVGEGLAEDADAIQVSGHEIRVYAGVSQKGTWVLSSSGGMGSAAVPKRVTSSIVVEPDDVLWMIRQIESEAWRKTGGVHCSALFLGKHLLVRAIDVGRHNTIDKIVGFGVLNDVELSTCIIACTGRQARGMVSKVANAGIPIIVSKAAPTDKGIRTADEAGVTLICFARGERFTIYSHPHRVSGVPPTADS